MRFDAATNQERRLRRMRRGVVTSAQLHRDMGGAVVAMITLTYRPDAPWSPQHISACLAQWRNELRGRKLRYVWVMELTKRGAPHYHVLVWLPGGARLHKPDQSGAWPHGWSQIAVARNPVGYLAKYASKGTSGAGIPRGARLFGVGGLDAGRRIVRSWKMLPRYIRLQCAAADLVRRMPGGGWLSRATGEWWPAWVELRGETRSGEVVTLWAPKGTVSLGPIDGGGLFVDERDVGSFLRALSQLCGAEVKSVVFEWET